MIEAEVEVLQVALLAEVGGLVAAHDLALVADVEFVLEHEFEELAVRQPVGFGFLAARSSKPAPLILDPLPGASCRFTGLSPIPFASIWTRAALTIPERG